MQMDNQKHRVKQNQRPAAPRIAQHVHRGQRLPTSYKPTVENQFEVRYGAQLIGRVLLNTNRNNRRASHVDSKLLNHPYNKRDHWLIRRHRGYDWRFTIDVLHDLCVGR